MHKSTNNGKKEYTNTIPIKKNKNTTKIETHSYHINKMLLKKIFLIESWVLFIKNNEPMIINNAKKTPHTQDTEKLYNNSINEQKSQIPKHPKKACKLGYKRDGFARFTIIHKNPAFKARI